MKIRSTFALVLALTLVVRGGAARAQEMGKNDDDEVTKLQAELVKEAKRFTTAIKLSAKEALGKAASKQPGIVTAIKAEQETTKDKDNKEVRTDYYEVTIVSKLEEPPPPPAKPVEGAPPPKAEPKKENKDAPMVYSVRVDADGKVTSKPAMEDVARDAMNEAKRLNASKATVTIAAAIDKVAAGQHATVISVVLEDREDRKDKKGEGYLVYCLRGEQVVWMEVDATTGEVEQKKV